MQFIPVKTRKFLPPKDELLDLLEYLPRLKEGDVVFITSKVLAITQGRCVNTEGTNKEKLIKQEADRIVKKPVIAAGSKIYLTIKNNIIIPSAGIDESNGKGYYILWPNNTQSYLKKIHDHLTKKNRIKKLGVVATDSHTSPMRWGVTGISIGFHGIKPLKDLRGAKDIFGKKLKYTQSNLVDALSSMAVLLMGESGEQTPMLLGRGLAMLKFTNKNTYKSFIINEKKDIYRDILKALKKT